MFELDPTIAEAVIALAIAILSWFFGKKKGEKKNM